jgi:anti-anti-sigma regulatory factor
MSHKWIDGADRVILNLDDLKYIDSAGLSALIWIWMEAKGHDAELLVQCNNRRIHRVLEITGLLKLFTVESPAGLAEDQTVPSVRPSLAGAPMPELMLTKRESRLQ